MREGKRDWVNGVLVRKGGDKIPHLLTLPLSGRGLRWRDGRGYIAVLRHTILHAITLYFQCCIHSQPIPEPGFSQPSLLQIEHSNGLHA